MIAKGTTDMEGSIVSEMSVRNRCLIALVLISSWPVSNFANVNREQIFPHGAIFLAVSLCVVVGTAVGFFFLLRKVIGGQRDTGITFGITAGLVIFFNYPVLRDAFDYPLFFLGLTAGNNYLYLMTLLGIPLLLLLSYRRRDGANVLVIMGLVATAWPTGALVWFLFTHETAELPWRRGPSVDEISMKPNVYYIVSDGYARHDQLRKRFAFDNTDLLEELRSRGFVIMENAFANYPSTFMSLTSSLLMDYIATEETQRFSSRKNFYRIIQGENPVVEGFKSNGYKYIHLGSIVWSGSACGSEADVCLSSNMEMENALTSLTPISYFRRKRNVTTMEDIQERLELLGGFSPYFLYAHTFPPHPPPTFDLDCTKRKKSSGTWVEKNKTPYTTDVKCVNDQLLQLLTILESRDPDAVVIWRSDHGTSFNVDASVPIDEWPRDAFTERFGIMLAVKVPERCREFFYTSMSPVNLFRVVFPCLGGRGKSILRDVSYVSPYEKHEQFGLVHRYE